MTPIFLPKKGGGLVTYLLPGNPHRWSVLTKLHGLAFYRYISTKKLEARPARKMFGENIHRIFTLYSIPMCVTSHKMSMRSCVTSCKWLWKDNIKIGAGPSGRAVWGVGLRPLACRDCGFESHRGHGGLSVESVVCCQLEVSATSWSLVQRSPADCGVSLCVI